MKPIALAVTATLCLAALTMTATSQSQTRNAGKVIYLGGVGSEDENSAQGGAIRHLGDFGAQCRYAWDKIKRLLEKHGATLENVDKVTTYVPTSAISLRPANVRRNLW